MKLTRYTNGQILYQGKPLDMYEFCIYLRMINLGKPQREKIVPSKATAEHVEGFIKTKVTHYYKR